MVSFKGARNTDNRGEEYYKNLSTLVDSTPSFHPLTPWVNFKQPYSVTRKKSPNVYKTCRKMILLQNFDIFTKIP